MYNDDIKSGPGNPSLKSEEAYLDCILQEWEQGFYKKAAELAHRGMEEYPNNWDIPYLYVDSMFQLVLEKPDPEVLGDVESICDYIIAASEGKAEGLTCAPPENSYKPYALRAFSAFIRKDFLVAEERFLEGLELYPDCPSLLSGHGWTLRELGSYGKAEAYFRAGLELDETHVDSILGYGTLLLFTKKRPDLALAVFENGLKHHPDDPELLSGQRASQQAVLTDRAIEIISGLGTAPISFSMPSPTPKVWFAP